MQLTWWHAKRITWRETQCIFAFWQHLIFQKQQNLMSEVWKKEYTLTGRYVMLLPIKWAPNAWGSKAAMLWNCPYYVVSRATYKWARISKSLLDVLNEPINLCTFTALSLGQLVWHMCNVEQTSPKPHGICARRAHSLIYFLSYSARNPYHWIWIYLFPGFASITWAACVFFMS